MRRNYGLNIHIPGGIISYTVSGRYTFFGVEREYDPVARTDVEVSPEWRAV